MTSAQPATPVLAVDGLTLVAGGAALTEDVTFSIAPGEMLALVGESGCGKSVTALAMMRLLPEPAVRVTAGRVSLTGRDITELSQAAMADIRGNAMGMVFQEPMTSLNPVLTVGAHVAEPLMRHRGMTRRQAFARAAALLDRVGIPDAGRALERYPHQMSGGQRQRVMIAAAIACEPKLLIADEPTTALDVTVQAQVLALINDLRREFGLACLLITHDLAVVSEYCDRALIMYAGRIVEEGTVQALFGHPRHRYTRALLETIPAANPPGRHLPAIPGQVPPPGERGMACAFAPRCAAASDLCREVRPPLIRTDSRALACWNPA
jgi:oligopeptide/dipeptide ABC transporter ATP-binding protein